MCPPDIDQTGWLPRHLQQWNILAPRIRRSYPISVLVADRGRSRILFNSENPWDAWSKLVSPTNLGLKYPCFQAQQQTGKLSALECLPPELITLILDELLLEKRDIVSLGLASTTLWMHILRHVWRDVSREMAPLAGVEIACIGSHVVDLPNGFVKENLVAPTVSICDCDRTSEAAKINWAAVSTYTPIEPSAGDAWRAALEAHHASDANIPVVTFRRLRSELASTCSTSRCCPRGTPWVLRNLTTKEYVRCRPPRAAPAKSRAYVDHPDVRLSIDDVLLKCISWTRAAPSKWDKESLYLHHGMWAGHCFDIVPLRQQSKLNVNDEWKDRTYEVVREMVGVANDILMEGALCLFRDVKSKSTVSKSLRSEVGRPKRTSRRKGASNHPLQDV